MTPNALQLPTIHRRSLLGFTVLGLCGCGGGGSGGINFAGPPGTVGSGLFSQGTITGFGSVIVNGVRFDDTVATVRVDGQPTTAQDLRLGMVVEVQGQRGADTTVGVANVIEAWSIAQGPVSLVQSGQITVAGMRVQTSSSTVFDGVSSVAALSSGMTVAVWGLQSAADGSSWAATRVARVSSTVQVTTGVVNAGPTVNGIRLSGAKAGSLTAGQLVRVQGSVVGPGNWQVDSVRLQGAQSVSSSSQAGEVEIEGLVTALLSGGHFLLGSTEVDASGTSLSSSLAALTIGQRVEVYGSWVGSILKATKLERENEQNLDQAEIEARIEQFTSLSNFVVRGQRCDASSAVIRKGQVSGLKVGVKVKLTGTKTGDVLRVNTLEIDD